jgi:hypothetical protein
VTARRIRTPSETKIYSATVVKTMQKTKNTVIKKRHGAASRSLGERLPYY